MPEPRSTRGRLLVVDDDPDMCELLAATLGEFHVVDAATDVEEAAATLARDDYDLVITDIDLGPVASGLDLCRNLAEARPDIPVIVITGFGSMGTAIEAIRAGAYDFVTKPIDFSMLDVGVSRALGHRRLRKEVRSLREQLSAAERFGSLIGASAGMKRVYELIAQVAKVDTSVVITGDSGTGKELVARAIHDTSKREGRFLAINCAAMPPTLLETELFGHVRGAFTDAKRSRDGLFVTASKGTLFLDEIGEMPIEMQAKLLRVLQERKVRPVGDAKEIEFDTRILCATNQDLEAAVDDGRFREDLFYRLAVVHIEIPPLRTRGTDVLLLAQHFLEIANNKNGTRIEGLDSLAARKLLDYKWPGNVRELENAVERAVALCKSDRIGVGDLPGKIISFRSDDLTTSFQKPEELITLAELERRYLERVLAAVGGNKTRAAAILGLDRRTLYRKLQRANSPMVRRRNRNEPPPGAASYSATQ